MDSELPESANSRDARIEALWKKLDPQGKGGLDINGLQKGLRKIDHPLKNASDLLKDVVNAMDKNGDHVIQYEEFRSFVMHTESELFCLFKSIDRDHNGKLDKGELKLAFKRAGLAVPNWKLDQFFAEVDGNNDGYITFDEWRNFLLFLPTNTQNPPLKAVLSYYSSTFALNSEGDTSIREETLEGLGTTSPMLFNIFFGAIVKIAKPPKGSPSIPPRTATTFEQLTPEGTADGSMLETNQGHYIEGTFGPDARPGFPFPIPSTSEADDQDLSSEIATPEKKSLLISLLPDPGYFAIGACAGVVSRTCTAPLDRLKVYLIAHTSPIDNSLTAAKKGNVAEATRKFGQPIILAYKDLLRAGGWRNLFAGNGLNVLKVAPESAIRFGSFEAAKRVLAHLEGHEDPKKINPYSKFLAGGFGGVMSQLVVYPVDTLKFRMQCETVSGGPHGNALIAEVFKKMQKQGYRAFYRGLNLGLIGMFPYSAIDLGTFEFLKASIAKAKAKKLGCHEEDANPGPFATAFIGAFSGAFGASVVYPLNLLRTRLQAQGTVLHPPTYTGFMDVFRKTVKNEGVKGLFKGITPNLIKVAPSVSITYVVYESGKKFLNLR